MECISPQSNFLPLCRSQLAYRFGCCGPQEPAVKEVNATMGLAPRGRPGVLIL